MVRSMKLSIFRTLAVIGICIVLAVIFLNRDPIVSAVTHLDAMLDLNNVFTGANTFPSINNTIYVDGNVYTTVAAAIAALPAAGGEIHVTTAFTPTTLGTIDPGTKAVTLNLAPETYNFTQIILRNNLRVIGAGSAIGTVLQSTSAGTDAIAVGSGSAVQGVLLQGFRLEGALGNTSQNGIHLNPSSGFFFEHSQIRDVVIGASTGFKGVGFFPDGTNAFAGIVSVDDVTVIAPRGATYCAEWLGFLSAWEMNNFDCEGAGQTAGGTNIAIVSTTTSNFPTSILFNDAVTEFANVGVLLSGAQSVTFHKGHFEGLNGGISINAGTATVALNNEASGEWVNVGVNGGSGYLVDSTAGLNATFTFRDNRIAGNPDRYLVGFTGNLTEIATTLTTTGLYRTNQLQAVAVSSVNQNSANQFSGVSACSSSTKAITYGTGVAFTNTPIVLVFDYTTKGGASLSAGPSTSGFTVSCTGAADAFGWIAIGNPN
jgi:hypothetical protein